MGPHSSRGGLQLPSAGTEVDQQLEDKAMSDENMRVELRVVCFLTTELRKKILAFKRIIVYCYRKIDNDSESYDQRIDNECSCKKTLL